MGSIDFLMNHTIVLCSCGLCCGKEYPCDKCVEATLRANGLSEGLATQLQGISHRGHGMSDFESKLRDHLTKEKKKAEKKEERKKKSPFYEYKKQYNDLFQPMLKTKDRADHDRILSERKAIEKKMEKSYGKYALYRSAPIHRTHKMGKWHSEVLAPAGTPRFYEVRDCIKCGAGEAHHAAGNFVDKELYEECHEK